MDPTRFDGLVRSLAQSTSRRRTVGVLLGGAATLLAGSSVGEAKRRHHKGAGKHGQAAPTDVCKANGKACSKGNQCCSGNCAPVPPSKTPVAGSGSLCCAAGQVQFPTGKCCTPAAKTTTCAGKCGTVTNNCGQNVDCGGCGACQACGTNHICVTTCSTGQTCFQGNCCTPTTCQAEGATCGSINDHCGGTLNCGSCSGNCQTCGTKHTCVSACTTPDTCYQGSCCTPLSICRADNGDALCGPDVDNKCGGTVDCGACPTTGQVCNGGVCCTPAKCAEGACGNVPDGCGGTVTCTCNAGDVCKPNGTCCTPLSVCKGPGGVALCGDIPDGCGGTAHCGACPTAGQVCKADGTCGISCNCGFHACNGQCVRTTDVAACGSACTPCPTDPHGTATCDGTRCGLTCDAGYHLCCGACVPDGGDCAPHCDAAPFCSGHGICNPDCSCTCIGDYTGALCDNNTGQPLDCTTLATCADCLNQSANNCIFCAQTTDSASGVCVTTGECVIPDTTCQCAPDVPAAATRAKHRRHRR